MRRALIRTASTGLLAFIFVSELTRSLPGEFTKEHIGSFVGVQNGTLGCFGQVGHQVNL